MVLLIECLVGMVLFTLIVVPLTLKDPLAAVGDYPPEVREKCRELGLIEDTGKRFSKADYFRKGAAMFVIAGIFILLFLFVNGTSGFWPGFRDSYILWLVITWYDAFIVDCGWFCHSRRIQIPGTEGMKAYKDYWFHIRQSAVGTLLGLPVCIVVGVAVALFS